MTRHKWDVLRVPEETKHKIRFGAAKKNMKIHEYIDKLVEYGKEQDDKQNKYRGLF